MLNEDVTCKFLRYIAVDTASDETTGTSPSTAGQFDLAKLLISELKEIGIPEEDIFFDSDHCYIYCRIKASSGIDVNTPKIGFIAHMDTSPEAPGKCTSPRFIENYDGKDLMKISQDQMDFLAQRNNPRGKKTMKAYYWYICGLEWDSEHPRP